MAKRRFVWFPAGIFLFLLLSGLFSRASAGTPGGAEEVMRRSALVQFYSGKDRMLYELVVFTIDKDKVAGYLATPKTAPVAVNR